MLWQIGVLIACLGAGWAIAHLLRRKLMSAKKEALAERLGVERFSRLLPPLFAMLLLMGSTTPGGAVVSR